MTTCLKYVEQKWDLINDIMVKIDNIEINNIGPIRNLKLKFNPHFNIICGSNGIGKTTILECLAESFCGNKYTLRKNSCSESGKWTIGLWLNQSFLTKTVEIDSARPNVKTEMDSWNFLDFSPYALYYKTNRTLGYTPIDAISKDPELNKYRCSEQLINGSNYAEIKKWFINRFLWSGHPGELSPEQMSNLEAAKQVFLMMSDGFSFDKIDHETNDIVLNSPTGKIVFEQLSSGFISFAIILLGLIKDIEYRFKEPHIKVEDFDGILIIDEMDVHLHPELQARIYSALDLLFPKAQIFTSTHSPHVIQVAKPEEMIPLVKQEDGTLVVNPIVNKEYGCQGWTIEEILNDVMGMHDTKSSLYKEELNKFNQALDADDAPRAHEAYDVLCKILHPDNYLRKVLEIQMVGLA